MRHENDPPHPQTLYNTAFFAVIESDFLVLDYPFRASSPTVRDDFVVHIFFGPRDEYYALFVELSPEIEADGAYRALFM